MRPKTTMVRTYATQHDFHTDEQKLSRAGWSVEPTVRQDQPPGIAARLRARFTRTPAPALVVTYSRQQPS